LFIAKYYHGVLYNSIAVTDAFHTLSDTIIL